MLKKVSSLPSENGGSIYASGSGSSGKQSAAKRGGKREKKQKPGHRAGLLIFGASAQ